MNEDNIRGFLIGFIYLVVFIFITLILTGCATKEHVIISEQNAPKEQKHFSNKCQEKYGTYPRTYNSYWEFKRCEFK
jgi:hypothetical protein